MNTSDQGVYRGYSADALQSQYSARAAVPEHPAIFERWARDSADYRQAAAAAGRARLDLAFGKNPRERIDLFLPEGADPAPLHVFFHGGYWQSMARTDSSFVARSLNDAGIAVAVPGYPLCPEVTLARIVNSARAAVAWLARADIPGVRPAPMHVAGHSAGGHLAALLALTDWSGVDPRLPAHPLSGVAPVSGVFELEPLTHTRINDALGLDTGTARALSAHDLTPPRGCHLKAFVGSDESDEFQRQSQAFVEGWRNRGGATAEYHRVDGCNHFTVLDALYAPGGPMIAAALNAA